MVGVVTDIGRETNERVSQAPAGVSLTDGAESKERAAVKLVRARDNISSGVGDAVKTEPQQYLRGLTLSSIVGPKPTKRPTPKKATANRKPPPTSVPLLWEPDPNGTVQS